MVVFPPKNDAFLQDFLHEFQKNRHFMLKNREKAIFYAIIIIQIMHLVKVFCQKFSLLNF
jgi:hypothetical protein